MKLFWFLTFASILSLSISYRTSALFAQDDDSGLPDLGLGPFSNSGGLIPLLPEVQKIGLLGQLIKLFITIINVIFVLALKLIQGVCVILTSIPLLGKLIGLPICHIAAGDGNIVNILLSEMAKIRGQMDNPDSVDVGAFWADNMANI